MFLADITDQRCSQWAGPAEVMGAAKPLDHQLHLCGAHVVEAEVYSDRVNGFACSQCPDGTVSHTGHTCHQRPVAVPRVFLHGLRKD